SANDTDNADDIYVRSGTTTTLASRADGAAGAKGNKTSSSPTISGDGSTVVFQTGSTNLGLPTPPGGGQAYAGTLATHATTVVSRSTGAAGDPANAFSAVPGVNEDATVFTFVSAADNLDSAAGGEFSEVFRRVLSSGDPTTLASRPDGTGVRSA